MINNKWDENYTGLDFYSKIIKSMECENLSSELYDNTNEIYEECDFEGDIYYQRDLKSKDLRKNINFILKCWSNDECFLIKIAVAT